MQLVDPDPNVTIHHCFLTLEVDAFGKIVNSKYKLELERDFSRQLALYKYPELLKQCQNVSLNLNGLRAPAHAHAQSQSQVQQVKGCDIHLNVPNILSSLDTSASPYFQQVQVGAKVEEQIASQLHPQVHGWVRYQCELLEPSFSISLHARNLKILEGTFFVLLATTSTTTTTTTTSDRPEKWVTKYTTYDPNVEIVQFWFDRQLPAKQKGEFIIKFQFDLTSTWTGMYVVNPEHLPSHHVRSQDEDEDEDDSEEDKEQKTKMRHWNLLKKSPSRIVACQFESMGARRVFPCFDLPGRKCSYTIRIISSAE